MQHGRTVAVLVLTATLATTGCGVTGPKVNFGKADGTIAQAEGPGVAGSLTTGDGMTVASGSLYFNPAAAVAEVMRYIGSLFNKGAGAAKSVSTPTGA